MLVTTISSQSRQENYVSEQDTSSDQHPEIPETKKEPDKTFCRAFWRRATIYGTAIVIAACIAPSIRFDNEAAARFGLAAATVTLFAFIDLLIYLFAYKEELSGYLFKIFKFIKNFCQETTQNILTPHRVNFIIPINIQRYRKLYSSFRKNQKPSHRLQLFSKKQ